MLAYSNFLQARALLAERTAGKVFRGQERFAEIDQDGIRI